MMELNWIQLRGEPAPIYEARWQNYIIHVFDCGEDAWTGHITQNQNGLELVYYPQDEQDDRPTLEAAQQHFTELLRQAIGTEGAVT